MKLGTALLNKRKRRTTYVSLLVCLAVVVTIGVGAIFHQTGVAKTYQKVVLTCTAEPQSGPGYAGFFVHTHNEDCYDENGTLVCALPEIEAHTHDAGCYTTVREPVCGIPESDGHVHTGDCYTQVRGDLTCELSTESVYDEEGNLVAEGHVHTDECYAWTEELSCGLQEGDGAHHHDDACYQETTVLTCDKPEVILHTHTEDCYQHNEDGSLYVDENGYARLSCGLPETLEHVHGVECFTVYELDDGEPEETENPDEGEVPVTETVEETLTAEGSDSPENGDLFEPAAEAGTEEEKQDGTEGVTQEVDTDAEPANVTEPAAPAQTRQIGGEKGGVTVLAEIPEGALSEYATLSLSDFDADYAKSVILSTVNADAAEGEERDISAIYAIDIGFTENGVAVPPNGESPIRVTLRTSVIRGMTNPKLYHLNHRTAEQVADAMFDIEAGSVSFSSCGFSPFAIADLMGEDPVTEAAEETAGVSMPAQNFTGGTAEVSVNVTAPEGAFPAGTRMEVTTVEVDDETMSSVEETVEGRVTTVQAVDISFYDADGNKIEPQTAIQVSMKSAVVSESENVSLIHKPDTAAVDDGAEAAAPALEVIDAAIVEQNDSAAPSDEITFESNAFSVYMLVGSETITTQYIATGGETYTITVTYGPEAGIPDGATLQVSEILAPAAETQEEEVPSEYSDYVSRAEEALKETEKVVFARFFDITILNQEGQEIQPAAPVSVKIRLAQLPQEVANDDAQIVHFGMEETEFLDTKTGTAGVSFETGSFSVYGVIYTVDFEHIMNGKVYQFSLPGGGFVSLEHLFEVLGIKASDPDSAVNAADEAFSEESGESEHADAATTYEQAISLNSVPVSEETSAFIADIETVEFSSPELVWVGKTNEESTVGALKETNGLDVKYSAELTEEQIAEIDAQTVKAGDWALISVRPFTSEETLTVTLKNGDQFVVRVTDAQIRKTVIDAKGDTWEITVTYDDSAVIPEGTELKVIEYSKNDLVFYRCHADREKWVADIIDNGENNSHDDGTITDIDNLTFEPGFGEAVNYDIDGDLSDEDKTQAASLIQFSGTPVISGYILFDISLIYNGTEIEPSAPVQVTIKSTNPDLKEYDDISVGHFVEKTTGISQELSMETIDEISYSSGDGKENDQVIVGFETSSFSLYDVTGIQWTANESKTVYFALKAGINQILDVDQHGAISIGYSDIKNMSGEEVASYIQGLNDYQSAEPIVIYNKSGDSFYAIDGDGNLAQVYESGDTVMWSGQPSIGWKLIRYMNDDGEYTGYYDFINMETGKFLTPSSTSTVGANRSSVQLDGAGLYSTTIKSWDNSVNTYVGYSINNGQLTTSASDEWYFAAVSQTVTDDLKLQTVETVDSRSLGITIKMFDYSNNCNRNNRSQEQTDYQIFNSDGLDWLGDGSVIQGLVQNKLNSEGYPVTTYANTNLKGLFSNGTDANKLFMLDTYQETGYFEYSSFQNFAHLNSNGDFTVYRQVGVEDTAKTPGNKTYGNATGTYYFNRGNFLPYNTIADYKTAVQKYGSSGVTNRYDENGNLLDGDDPRNGENLFLTQETVDYFFGMSMEADFYQPADGKNNGQDIIYEFNGDDDLWIFVDNVLVLDIGGCHHAHSGTINFTTGTVEVVTGRGTSVTTIRQCFKNAGVFPDGTAWDDSKANLYFSGDTFADYSQHNMKMFYMERGAGASNLHIKFNLPVIKDAGKLIVDKVVSGTVNQKYSNEKFAFQVIKVNGNTETRFTNAVYDSDGLPVEYKHEAEINGITYNDVFYLRPGEAAVFDVADNSQQYYVKELGIDSNYYDLVKINGVQTSIDSNGNVTSTVNTVRNRTRVTYDNHGITDNLRIKKQVEGDVKNQNALFEFYVYLTGPDDTLIPYSNGEYYVLDPNGYYCTYVDGFPVGDPTITEDTRTAYESGEWGTIGSLPEGYTILIEDLLVGTDFMVSERDNRIPEGYEYKSNTVVEGTAGTAGLNAYTNVSVDQSGSMNIGSYSFSNHSEGQIISSNENDATVVVTNTLKYSIQAEKLWVNADNVTTHGTVQAALFKVDDGSGTYTVDSTKYTLVDGSVKEIKAGEVTTWKIVDAPSNYIIREVMVDGTTVTPIDDNGMIAVSGETMKVSDGSQSAISDGKNIYIATYDQGVEANNTRKDTVTNTLPQIVLYKVDMTNLSKYLSDAVFTLSNADGTSVGEASYTSDSDGLIAELQLPVGTWYLTETNAPAGYNMLTDTVKLTVNENGTVKAMLDGSVGSVYTDQTNTDITKFTFNIPNNPGVELPSTGGPGTRLFMILGSMLSLGAGLLLWRRRRTI